MKKIFENETVKNLISDLERRVQEKILEPNNLVFLKKLLEKAEDEDEAITICKLGTTYHKTGLIYEKKLEVPSDSLKFFKKNEDLSFDRGGLHHKLIIGDNYDALKNLLIQYRSQIDVIYIDPPYGKDSMGEFAKTNYENQIDRDNLLSMLHPRLILARQLLSENGVMFCSIDDRNYAYVKCLFDEVFGESKIETYIWCLQDKSETSFTKTASATVRKEHEYIIATFNGNKTFSKYSASRDFEGSINKNPDNDPRGDWFSGNISRNGIKTTTGSKYYTITSPTGVKYARNWTLSKEEFDQAQKDNRIYFSKDGDGVPRLKIFANENNYLIQSSLFTDVHTSITGKREVGTIFSEAKKLFDFPKPTSLIYRLLEIVDNPQAVVLDFFAGTGTTGQAVLDINSNDEGQRQFICVQLDEDIDSSLKTADKLSIETLRNQSEFCDIISRPHKLSEITTERLRRIMTGKSIKNKLNFDWINSHEKYGDSLDVYDIDEISVFDETIFDKIDETLYGKDKFTNIKNKIKWVTDNFEKVTRKLQDASRD